MNPRACLALAVALSGLFLCETVLTSATAHASTAQSSKKKKKAPKLTSKSIVKWKKMGMADDEIVSRANDGGFRMTPLARTNLKKAHMSPSLIAALDGQERVAPAAPVNASREISIPEETEKPKAKAKPVNLAQIGSDADIDFDSVPPPSNMPTKYVRKDSPAPKKQLDRSTRPSAPFDENAQAEKPVAQPVRTKVAVASEPQPRVSQASASSSSANKKRVVYSASPSGGQ